MAVPGIELRWGDRDYPAEGIEAICGYEQRAMLRPKLQRSIDIALEGLDTFGIELVEPKRLVVHALVAGLRGSSYFAESTAPKTMHLYLKQSAARGHFNAGSYGLTLLHEMMHCVRQEKTSITSLGELAATEGIAYMTEYSFYDYANPWKDTREFLVNKVINMPKDELVRLRSELAMCLDGQPWNDELRKKWMKPVRAMHDVRVIDVIGIAAVHEQVAGGRGMADLVHAPTSEVLGFEAA